MKNRFYRSQSFGLAIFLRFVIDCVWPHTHRNSPEFVVSKKLRQGVKQAEIRGEHLTDVYRKLRPMLWTPAADDDGVRIPKRHDRRSGSLESLWGVVVEPRSHPLLEYVVSNIHSTLGIPVQIYHGKGSREFILESSLGVLVEKGEVVLSELNVSTLPPNNLGRLMVSNDFWQSMEARRRILFFQTDSLVCKNSEYTVSDFDTFDYIGSKWKSRRPNGLIIRGGSGGISLRSWEAAVECINRFPLTAWEGASDEYFAFHIPIMGGKVGSALSCSKFATEEVFATKSFAAHKISRLPENQLTQFLEYCPEARPLVEYE